MFAKCITILAVAGSALLFVSVSNAQYTPDANTVALYHFDNTGGDASGNGKHGTVVGASFGPGRFGAGLDFCGSSTCYFLVPRDASLEPSAELTVEFWLFNRGGGSGNETILRKAVDCDAGFKATIAAGTFNTTAEGPSTCSGQYIICGVDATAFRNRWTHYAWTYDPTNGLRSYINGVLMCTVGPEEYLLQHSGDLYIGASLEHPSDGGVSGAIDEVRISDIARSPSEFLGIPPPMPAAPRTGMAVVAITMLTVGAMALRLRNGKSTVS